MQERSPTGLRQASDRITKSLNRVLQTSNMMSDYIDEVNAITDEVLHRTSIYRVYLGAIGPRELQQFRSDVKQRMAAERTGLTKKERKKLAKTAMPVMTVEFSDGSTETVGPEYRDILSDCLLWETTVFRGIDIVTSHIKDIMPYVKNMAPVLTAYGVKAGLSAADASEHPLSFLRTYSSAWKLLRGWELEMEALQACLDSLRLVRELLSK